MPKISIIIPVLGQKWYTDAILADIPLKVKSEYEIIVLDWPDSVNFKWNKGVEQAKGEYIWIINNDLILTEWLDIELVALLDTYKIACPFTTEWRDKFMLPKIKNTTRRNIAWWCFMQKKDDWIQIDNRLDLYYGDNWIFEKHKGNIGWGWLCHHFRSSTIKTMDISKRIRKDNLTWHVICDEQWWDNY